MTRRFAALVNSMRRNAPGSMKKRRVLRPGEEIFPPHCPLWVPLGNKLAPSSTLRYVFALSREVQSVLDRVEGNESLMRKRLKELEVTLRLEMQRSTHTLSLSLSL